MMGFESSLELDTHIDKIWRNGNSSVTQDINALSQYAEYLRVRGNPALIAASRLTNPELLAPFEAQLKESLNEIPR